MHGACGREERGRCTADDGTCRCGKEEGEAFLYGNETAAWRCAGAAWEPGPADSRRADQRPGSGRDTGTSAIDLEAS